MKSSNQKYDYIVYGGTPAGVLFACGKCKKGKRVLLINHYGFLGGSITSSLNCFQLLNESGNSQMYCDFISLLKSDPHGIMYSDGVNAVINPESLKMLLQYFCITSEMDILFHVNPLGFKIRDDNTVALELLAKEGRIKINGTFLIDASENHLLKKLAGSEEPESIFNSINCFITKPETMEFADGSGLKHAIKLNDGRYFLSRAFTPADPLFNNNYVDQQINIIQNVVSASGARIQLMPVEEYSFYEFINLKTNDISVYAIEDLLGKKFSYNEQLLKAAEIDRYLTDGK